MFVPFQELPESSRIWVYQASRPFTAEELSQIEPRVESFLTQWTVHGSNLHAGYELKYNRFLIFGLDQGINSASGCSIDSSVHFIQDLEREYNVELLDKMNVSFKQGEYITYKPLIDFKKMVKSRSVSPKTIVFNNLVNTKAELEHDWEVPLQESWHKRFL